jgi:hypothetical protein
MLFADEKTKPFVSGTSAKALRRGINTRTFNVTVFQYPAKLISVCVRRQIAWSSRLREEFAED